MGFQSFFEKNLLQTFSEQLNKELASFPEMASFLPRKRQEGFPFNILSMQNNSTGVDSFESLITLEMEASGEPLNIIATKTKKRVFVLYHISLTKEGFVGTIASVSKTQMHHEIDRPLGDDLVPIIKRTQYRSYANEILAKYLPDALTVQWRGSATSLPKMMGLNWCFGYLSEKHKTFGSILFCPKEMTVFEFQGNQAKPVRATIPELTIVLDPTALKGTRNDAIALTVAHECVHYYLHKKAIHLLSVSLKDYVFEDPVDSVNFPESRRFMEIQAIGIAPFIAMPTDPFLARANTLFHLATDHKNNTISLRAIELIIGNLAKRFHVTKQAAKNRLEREGYEEVRGTLQWADGQYVKPFFSKQGTLAKTETFVISLTDCLSILAANERFRKLLSAHFYLFVDNRVVINNKKYVAQKNGRPSLTSYALSHPDECCVVFEESIKKPGKETDTNLDPLVLLRSCDALDLNAVVTLARFPEKSKDPSFVNEINLALERENQVIKQIEHLSFSESFDYICKLKGIRNKDISVDTGIPEATISRYRSGKSSPRKENFVLLCVSLGLGERIAKTLLRNLDFSFKKDSKRDQLLWMCLVALSGSSFKDINAFLKASGEKAINS